ncbi:MAG: response regulator [Magnetococcus sp. MYC-9]
MTMFNVYLADDHAILRQGLKSLLKGDPELQIAGESGSGRSTIEDLARGGYDLLVLDLSLPDMDGFEVLQEVKRHHPDLPVMILTLYVDAGLANRGIELGASGYVLKEMEPHRIVDTMRCIARGGQFLAPELAASLAGRRASPFKRVSHLEETDFFNQQTTALNARSRITELAIGQLPYGIIVFDAALRPVYLNQAAEVLLASDTGLVLTSGKGLTTALGSESKRLQQLLRQGADQATGSGAMTRNAMRITPCREELHPISAVVVPLSPGQRKKQLLASQPGVMLFLSSLNQSVTGSIALLKSLFDLTGAEAYLAQELVSGRTLEAVTIAKGCSLNTVRNQLKAVFAKTGTSRQADLIRLLNSLPLSTSL